MTAPALCRACGRRLILAYPGQGYHPLCDPDPPGWTDEQLAEWGARVAARKATEQEQAAGRPGAGRRSRGGDAAG